MTSLFALILTLTRQDSPNVTRVNLFQQIHWIAPVGPPDSHLALVQALGSTVDPNRQVKTMFFLVDAVARKVSPLPFATLIGEQKNGSTLDMVMSPREVWRVPLSHPSVKTVVRTPHDIQSVCFAGDSGAGYYVQAPSKKSASKLIHLIGAGRERQVPLSSGSPLNVLDCLPERCLIQFDDGTDEEGSQRFHLACISTSSGKRIGMRSELDRRAAGDRLEPERMAGGLLLDCIQPAIAPSSIGGPKLQLYKVLDLAHSKVVGHVQVPYPQGQHAGMGISCSDATTSCVFCVETLEVHPTMGKNGTTQSNARFRRYFYRYRMGATQLVDLFDDTVTDTSAKTGNAWSTQCALTNDGRYLVATGRNEGEVEIVAIRPT